MIATFPPRARPWAFLLLALARCDGETPPGAVTCETLQCPEGSSCDAGVCLADAPDDYRIAVRFAAPGDEAGAEWVGPAPVSTYRGELPFAFLERHLLHLGGKVRWDGAPVAAYVEVRRASPLPGRAPIVFGRFVAADQAIDLLVPATGPCSSGGCPFDYVLTAWSVDPRNPFPPTRVDLSQVDVANQDVVVPETETLKGAVLRSNAERFPNLRVLAVDPMTGEALSASSFTTNPGGEFRLEVPAANDTVAIRVEETGLDAGRALPTIQSAPLSVQALSVDEADGARIVPLSVVVYSRATLVQLSGTVEGRPRAGGRVAVGDAMLRFLSDDLGAPGVADVTGTLEKLVRSDGGGNYEIELSAGTYTVEIVPPATDGLADIAVGVVSQFVNAPANDRQSGIVLDVPPRLALGGTIQDAVGRPLDQARIELRAGLDLADRELARVESTARTVHVRATAEGAFLALVDPGHFDVVIRPAVDKGLPWHLLLGYPVLEDTTMPQPLIVRPGQRLSGVVIDAEGEVMAGATVDVWCLTEDDASALCGQATTDDEGRYSVLLPAALEVFPAPPPL